MQAWLLPLDAWRPYAQQILPAVGRAQRERCEKLRDPAVRSERLLAHALHRMALSEALDLPPDAIALHFSATGQPRTGLTGLHTSLSHAAGIVAAALGTCACGIDVEPRATAPLSPIADLVCTPGELAALPRDAQERQARLLATWVGKEAVLKAAGVGLAREMSAFELRDGHPIEISDAEGRELRLYAHMHDDGGPWVAALASESADPPLWQWRHPDPTRIEST